MPVSNADRRAVITLYRFHYPGSPAQAAQALVAYGRQYGFTRRTDTLPGETLRRWATTAKAPLWAVGAAAHWLKAQAIAPQDAAEKAVIEAAIRESRT